MDKKLKNAGGKITMPEDMKERIIKACETAEKNRITRTDSDDGYTEVASGTERVSSRNRIIRTVSAAAACAVLMAGIGTTGFLLHKQNNKMAGSDIVEEINSPFGDFSTFEYRFDAGDGKYGKYSAETYSRLSDFLNKFNWGEPVEKPEGRDIDADVEETVYDIKWTKGDTPPIECNLHIANDGYVSYQESMMSFETGAMASLGDIKWYLIDFDAFDSGIQAILAQDTEKISPFGNFRVLDFELQSGIGIYNKYNSSKLYGGLADMLNNFDWGEGVYEPVSEESVLDFSDSAYTVSWELDGLISWINIESTGRTVYVDLKYDDDHLKAEELCRRIYQIDIEDFRNKFSKIVSEDEYIDQNEIDRLTRGKCKYAVIQKYGYGSLIPEDEEDKERLDDLLKNRFVHMLKVNIPSESYDSEQTLCDITFEYKIDEKNSRTMYFTVLNNGVVSMSEYTQTDDGSEPSGSATYAINIEEFKDRLADAGIDIDSFASEEAEETSENNGITFTGDMISPFDNKVIYDADGKYDPVANIKHMDQNIEKFISQFPDIRVDVCFEDENMKELVPADEQTREQIESFIRNDFESMLKYDSYSSDFNSDAEHRKFFVVYSYMSGDKEIFHKGYSVSSSNLTTRSDCLKVEGGNDEWRGPYSCTIDYNAFAAKLAEFGLI
ncbi:MAG: hypothetical protein IKW96_02725 [Ruminococcus sp.]|uniref:hypothetical protein n=1 Tax=Ruminococcus sp. TaxID=41978 RepID=UPI0025F6B79B|nr:hypothetical protein [Ruminococcus sp.]MBR5682187.1 hypothetical protein [Ruminococcus sp.]